MLRQKREMRELSDEVAALESTVAGLEATVTATTSQVLAHDELIQRAGERIQALSLKHVEVKQLVLATAFHPLDLRALECTQRGRANAPA